MASSSHTVTINGSFPVLPGPPPPANYIITNWQITFTSLDASPYTITSIQSVTGVGNIYTFFDINDNNTYEPNATTGHLILDLKLYANAITPTTNNIQYLDINQGEASEAQLVITEFGDEEVVTTYGLNYDNIVAMDPFQYTNNNTPSNICFPANTPITIDQGIVAIEKLNPAVHTIDNKRIVAITKTTSVKDYLVRLDKDALGENLPNETTTISPDHKILYKGQLIKAKYFIAQFENVYKVDYKGESLYNVLLEEYYKMNVNNLIVETLHPESDIAQLYNGNARGKKTFYIIKNTMNSIIHKSEPVKNTTISTLRR
jgi:hypothetical protein